MIIMSLVEFFMKSLQCPDSEAWVAVGLQLWGLGQAPSQPERLGLGVRIRGHRP